MKIKYYISIVKDERTGNTDYVVYKEYSDIVFINGMHDENGNYLYFETDAYKLEGWCESNKLKYKEIIMEEEITS